MGDKPRRETVGSEINASPLAGCGDGCWKQWFVNWAFYPACQPRASRELMQCYLHGHFGSSCDRPFCSLFAERKMQLDFSTSPTARHQVPVNLPLSSPPWLDAETVQPVRTRAGPP